MLGRGLGIGLGIGSGDWLGLGLSLSLRVEHGLLQSCVVVFSTGLEQEVCCLLLVLVTREVGLGSPGAAESERLKTLDRFVLLLGHLDAAWGHLLTAATSACRVGSRLASSTTGTHVGNRSLKEHHEDLRVGLNRSIDVGLLLLEILHEHRGEVLVGEQPLTDSWEAGVRHQSL